jgi:enamine deaminase RidA (YjgF/YER057c/UK114 family)
MNDVWDKWVDPDNLPVRATVEARLATPELLVEIQVTALV